MSTPLTHDAGGPLPGFPARDDDRQYAKAVPPGHFVQPKITGYRQLSDREVAMMNAIKAKGEELQSLVNSLRAQPEVDQRWVAIGTTDLQTGLMALTRAVARPTSF